MTKQQNIGHIPHEAIEKAIEGGWKRELKVKSLLERSYWHWDITLYNDVDDRVASLMYAEIALDPSFWQALGKALGWEKTICRVHLKQDQCGIVWTDTVGVYAHRFYDLILQGQDAMEFWKELLE